MKKKIIKQIPNIITITRIISLIIGFILFCKEKFLYAIILYIYGAVSDFFDGYFARRLNAYTKLGKYLDAISDKLYSFSVMILLIINRSILIVIPLLLEGIISFVNYKIIIKYKKCDNLKNVLKELDSLFVMNKDLRLEIDFNPINI